MIRISQYSVTNIRMLFVIIFSPIIAIANFLPNVQEAWNFIVYLQILVSGWGIWVLIIILKGSRRKIIFTSNNIHITDLFHATKEFTWTQINGIEYNYRYIIKRYKIAFDKNYDFLFEANDKTIKKIIEICPVLEVKNQFKTMIS
ncbi:hypothetical protein [Paracholeplasma manati]|uniref:PH domain-containing protein n=1 Tax=Paracholeplasma manati TaxID=591373 RepID=A0ABT2Y5B9_9MOLU|nr:hypothetical protein [Paracholeplasma manati]MCV2231923.1 hypothetical protein [Paracholeplasma manati]MDG0888924.1 hypothetical protein [Paracholeplasma manati]